MLLRRRAAIPHAEMKTEPALVAALDIGGTKIAAGVVDAVTGDVSNFRQVATEPERGGTWVAQKAAHMIAELQHSHIQGIAISICEIVDRSGQLRSKDAFDWMSLNLQQTLKTDLPIHLVSDVRAAALAEARFGAAKGIADALYVSIGTGISSTLLINGVPYAGAHGAALVLATAERSQHCDACGVITRQSLEHIASGAGLAQCYGQGINAKEVIRRAESGESDARKLVERATRELGQVIAQLANCTDPHMIIIGGGLGSADGLYWMLLRPAIESGLWKDRPATPTICRSSLGPDRGVVGAAFALGMGMH